MNFICTISDLNCWIWQLLLRPTVVTHLLLKFLILNQMLVSIWPNAI